MPQEEFFKIVVENLNKLVRKDNLDMDYFDTAFLHFFIKKKYLNTMTTIVLTIQPSNFLKYFLA